MKTIARALVSITVGVLVAGCGESPDSPDNGDFIKDALANARVDAQKIVQENPRTTPTEKNTLDATPPTIEVLKPEAIRALIDDAKGTVVVVNFWATWCPPCVNETPELIKFYQEHHGKFITFLSLCVDDPSTIEKAVKPFVAEHTIPFPIYVVDERDPKIISEVLELGMSGALPTTWLIDAKGMPVRSWVEEVTAAELAAVARPLFVPALAIPRTFQDGSDTKKDF